MNRALLLRSFYPEFAVHGASSCDDVQHMLRAVNSLQVSKDIECGDAGTVLRFMALRVSRLSGTFRLHGSQRLFERPQEDLLFLLNQLGVRCEMLPRELVIESRGWKKPLVRLRIHREKSSQFSTALLLSAWDLGFPLEFELTPAGLTDSYWQMSLDFAAAMGMEIQMLTRDHLLIPARQHITATSYEVEPDYSSMFSVAVTAALGGEARIAGVGAHSLQPDYGFIQIMRKMKIPILLENSNLGILRAQRIFAQDHVITDTPDLFPVLSVLCAFAEGTSRLMGAPRLIYKESNRIRKTAELLQLMGVKSTVRADGIEIEGLGMGLKTRAFSFDPDHDHRMAMAVGVLMRLGWSIQLAHPQVVNKSFPEYWEMLGVKP